MIAHHVHCNMCQMGLPLRHYKHFVVYESLHLISGRDILDHVGDGNLQDIC
jgi:hypothetical protein